jgi:small membrane protein
MMTIIQIVLVLFILFALSRAWLRFKDKKIHLGEFIFWVIVWVGAITAITLPETLGYASKIMGIGRPVDLLVYASIALLFYLNFRQYVKMDEQNAQISKIVTEVAIKRAKKK